MAGSCHAGVLGLELGIVLVTTSGSLFHDTTIFAFNTGVHCVIAVGLLVSWLSNREVAGVKNWSLAYLNLTLGFVVLLAAPWLTAPVARGFLAMLMFYGMWHLMTGLCLYRKQKPPSSSLFLAFFAVYAMYNFAALLVWPNYAMYHVGMGLAIAPLALLTARVSVIREEGEGPAYLLIATTMTVVALGLTAQAITAAVAPPGDVANASLPLRTQIILFVSTMASTAIGLGLVIMTSQAHKRELIQQATIDPLTKLLNRRAFYAASLPALAQCRREQLPVTVMMMDLDHFKTLNDTFGHMAGDEVLKGFADLVRQCLRGQDIIGRFGGEEFIAVLPRTGAEAARVVAERLRVRLEGETFSCDGQDLRCTVSIGISCHSRGESELDEISGEADGALYRAKDNGRNRIELVVDGEYAESPSAAA